MRISSLLVTFVAAAIVAGTAVAQNEEPGNEVEELEAIDHSSQCKSPELNECQALLLAHYCKFLGSSYNAVHCAGGRRAEVEANLNATYRQVLDALRKQASAVPTWANASKMLIEAQRAWIRFRERECDVVAESFNGGTLQPAIGEDCMREEAERRIQTLKKLAKLYGAAP